MLNVCCWRYISTFRPTVGRILPTTTTTTIAKMPITCLYIFMAISEIFWVQNIQQTQITRVSNFSIFIVFFHFFSSSSSSCLEKLTINIILAVFVYIFNIQSQATKKRHIIVYYWKKITYKFMQQQHQYMTQIVAKWDTFNMPFICNLFSFNLSKSTTYRCCHFNFKFTSIITKCDYILRAYENATIQFYFVSLLCFGEVLALQRIFSTCKHNHCYEIANIDLRTSERVYVGCRLNEFAWLSKMAQWFYILSAL